MARLRSQGPVMTAMDSLSKASGRKRRASSPLASPRKDGAGASSHQDITQPQSTLMKTPGKAKKRVRFSDPGPETSAIGSTGLTPFVARTSLAPRMDKPVPGTSRLLSLPPRRRASMPEISTSTGLGTAENPIEIHQFAPLRQMLTPRTRRQLKRNHLSEEMNCIEADKRSISKLQREVQELRDELELAKQLGVNDSTQNEDRNCQRIRDLEREIMELKREGSVLTDPDLSLVADTTFLAEDSSVDLVRSESGYGTASPSAIGAEDTEMTIPSSPCPARDASTTTTHAETSTASIQTDITSQSLSTLYSFASSQNKQLTRARLSLEHMYPGSIPLSLTLSSDAGPLLDTMLSRLKGSRATLATCRATLAASQTQESNLRAKFNASLKQLDEARGAHAKLIASSQQTPSSSAQVAAAHERVAELEAQVRDYETRHERTTSALDKYREDVNGLQALVQTLEIEHAGAMARLTAERDEAARNNEEKDEAVADLECMVAAETRGRREAESECDELGLRAKEAKEREREAKAALNEKQRIVRELEGRVDGMKLEWEKEVGGLNARIGQLCAEVENKKLEVRRAEHEVQRLLGCVRDEKEAGRRSIEKMMGEIGRCRVGAERIGEEHAKGAEVRDERVISALGLLTPSVEGGRFRDVGVDSESCEGRVEVGRGKRRRRKVDSGIGILIEDGGEE